MSGLNGTGTLTGAALDFGEHNGHLVYPHNHAGQPNEEPHRRDKWCSQRWLCQTCTSEDLPRGTWFDGPECPRPVVVRRGK